MKAIGQVGSVRAVDLRRLVSAALASVLVVGLAQLPVRAAGAMAQGRGLAAASVASTFPAGSPRAVPVVRLQPKVRPLTAMASYGSRAPTWPSPATVVVDTSAVAAPVTASVGGLPVTVSPAGAVPAPAKVRIEVLDHAASQRVGAPVVVKLSRADGGVDRTKVGLSVDISGFREAFGGVYASRLRLSLASECAPTAVPLGPAGACQITELPSTLDFRRGTLSSVVDLGGGAIVMLTSSPSTQSVGTFAKTDLKESGTWAVGANSGNFSYQYALPTPPVPGALSPNLSLTYSSASVDGQTAAEHLQNGPLGEGWSLVGGGFIERTFRPCALDNSTDHPATWTNATGDPCWRYDNFQLSWFGGSGELVPTATANVWRIADDDGAKAEYLPASGSWRVTTLDGTQYAFGLQRLPGWTAGARETRSQLAEEMFANHSGEPCFSTSGYTYSHCTMTYRWLLDYVLDPHGNSMSYWYNRYNNVAGSNGSGQPAFWYDRDAVLDHIEYGSRTGNETATTAPARVDFTNADRCLADCGTEANPNTANWYDTPFDLRCTAAPCNNNKTPSYWTTKRLTKVTTRVWTGSGTVYKPVDEWTFAQSFPGGTDVPTLWLDSITHAGYDSAGNSITTPPLRTHGRKDNNRADYDANAGMADPEKYRIDSIDTEAGARISVSYLPINQPGDPCTWWSGKTSAQWPNYDDDAARCFLQLTTNRSNQSGWTWWHKFVVDKVTETDLVGGSPDKVTSYSYSLSDGTTSNRPIVLWGYSRSWWASPYKSMSSWKGYPSVTITVGTGTTKTVTKRIYYRGLDRDTGLNLPGEEFFRTSSVVDTEGGSVPDHQAFAGQIREEINYSDGVELSKTINTPTVVATSAGGTLPTWQTPPERYAFLARDSNTKVMTRIADGTWRSTETESFWDSTYGLLTRRLDMGQSVPALASDDLCTRYSYAMNTITYLIAYPSLVETYGDDDCISYAGSSVQAITRTYYDNGALGAAPAVGNPTKTEQLKSWSCGLRRPPCSPTMTYITSSAKTFDPWGRATSNSDPLGHISSTSYAQDSAGLLSTMAITTPAPVTGGTGFTTTTGFDPLRGLPTAVTDPNGKITVASYDPLGRLTKVVKPGNTTGLGDVEYGYSITQSAAPYTHVKTLGPNGNQISSFEILDGLLRLRQIQTTAPDGKSTVSDTRYDERGLTAKTSVFYDSASAPSSAFVWPTNGDADIDRQTRYSYDGAARRTVEELFSRGVSQYRSTTIYEGDRVGTLPPLGGTVTQDVLDARGRVVEKRRYQNPAALVGAYDRSTYSYDRLGLPSIVSEDGTSMTAMTWRYTHDSLGRTTAITDPDAGTIVTSYDDAGNVTATTDGRGQKLFYAYDNLNRKVLERADTSTGAIQATWTYDTVAKGQLTSSTRYDGSDAYTHQINSFDDGYRPTSTTDTIPGFGTAGGTLAYTVTSTYEINGAPATLVVPGVGGLPNETLSYGYDNSGLPQSLAGTWAGGYQTYINAIEYHYDGLAHRQYLGNTNRRARLTTDYDPATRRLSHLWTSVETTTPGSFAVPYDYVYGYDGAGNITSIAGNVHGVADQEECFHYDYLRQLSEAWTQTSGNCTTPQRTGADPYHRQWTYDAIGNRLTQTDIDTTNTDWINRISGTDSCGGLATPRQLRQVDATGPLAAAATRTFCYDAAGNVTKRTTETGAVQTLAWDKEGHLQSLTDAGDATTYVYTASGARLSAKTAAVTTLYLPDGAELTKTNATGAVAGTRYYASIGVRDASGLKWIATNHQGTSAVQIDAATLAYQRRRFLPYGEPRGSQPSWLGTKGYVNGTEDDSGLTHLGAREFDPSTGSFASADPVLDLANPQQWNPYSYSANNPTTWSDPGGLMYPNPGTDGGGSPSTCTGTPDRCADKSGKNVSLTPPPPTGSCPPPVYSLDACLNNLTNPYQPPTVPIIPGNGPPSGLTSGDVQRIGFRAILDAYFPGAYDLGVRSFGFCGSMGASAWNGASVSMCWGIDELGFAHLETLGYSKGPSIGVSAGGGWWWSNGNLDDQDGRFKVGEMSIDVVTAQVATGTSRGQQIVTVTVGLNALPTEVTFDLAGMAKLLAANSKLISSGSLLGVSYTIVHRDYTPGARWEDP